MAGFTKIENKILEKILTSEFTKRQLKILLLIVRFSYDCQKSYAILKNKDFSYAKVSTFCIKDELRKLVEKRVISRNTEKRMVWINKNLTEWAVDNSVDSSETFIKIATENLPKQQYRGCQNSNTRNGNNGNPLTKKQRQALHKFGIQNIPDDLTKKEASEILNKLISLSKEKNSEAIDEMVEELNADQVWLIE